MRIFLLLLLAVTLASGEETAPWPRELRAARTPFAPVPPPAGTTAAWRTTHFLLYSDDPVNAVTLQRFANVIESVPRLLESLPLPLLTPTPDKKPVIRLCRDEFRFLEMGGRTGAMGYYNGRKREIIIRADVFLKPPTARPSRLIPEPNQDLLVHELVHLGMHDVLNRTKPWLYEGMAEYLAAAHRKDGYYSFERMDSTIRDHVRRNLPPDKQGFITLPPVATLLRTTPGQWSEFIRRSADHDAYRPYALSLLLIHYHLKAPQRMTTLSKHLTAVRAHRNRRVPLPTLTTDDPKVIQQRLQAYWKPKGLNLRFEQ